MLRIMEAHSGLSAIVGEAARFQSDDGIVEFDGLWESSLTDSATKGLPDVEIISLDSRISTINEIMEVTQKPLIVDGDTGRTPLEFEFLVRRLERLGVSAVIIEDKVFPKRNSLDTSAKQTLEDPVLFGRKIARGKLAVQTEDFYIIARLESLIAGTGLEDALERAEIYINSGVDGVMIHSQRPETDEILAFAKAYGPLCERLGRRPPLVCVPTTYNNITDVELAEHGFNIMIHANHLLRSSYKAMEQAALSILTHDRSLESEELCTPTSRIFEVVGFNKIKEQDKTDDKAQRYSVIIPAAGKDPVFTDTPKSMVQVGDRPIIDHQVERVRKSGLTNNRVVVVRGYEAGQFTRTDVDYFDNNLYEDNHSLHSLFCAEPAMSDGFVMIYSDVLFDEALIQRLVETENDIVLLLDNSYRHHQHDLDKKLELVVSARQSTTASRSLSAEPPVHITRIGKDISKQDADYEFVGIAFFSARGAQILRDVYADAKSKNGAPFQESASFQKAAIVNIIQEIIDQGFPVHGLELTQGWIEIHNPQDVIKAEEELIAGRSGVR